MSIESNRTDEGSCAWKSVPAAISVRPTDGKAAERPDPAVANLRAKVPAGEEKKQELIACKGRSSRPLRRSDRTELAEISARRTAAGTPVRTKPEAVAASPHITDTDRSIKKTKKNQKKKKREGV
jgi:hypothetical protein